MPTMITNLPRRFVSLYSISIEGRASLPDLRRGRDTAGRLAAPPGWATFSGGASIGMRVPGSIWAGGTSTHRQPSGCDAQNRRTRVRFRSGDGRLADVPDFRFVAPFEPTGDQP